MLKKIICGIVLSLLLVSMTKLAFTAQSHGASAGQLVDSLGPLSTRGLVEEWRFHMCEHYHWGYFGSSAAIADLGPSVNNNGSEPDSNLEIVTGSDEYANYYWELGNSATGIWRCLDSRGNLEWAKASESDETRGSVAIIDVNGDGQLELVGGTTSGETVEVMNRTGGFIWTFPNPPRCGSFYYPDAPAVADLIPTVGGLEVVIGNRPYGTVLAFDGDNSDGINEGVSATGIPGSPYGGVEGKDWDLLWIFQTGAELWSTPAVGDVDNDGILEVVIGSTNGNLYVLNGLNGSQEHAFSTGGAVYASAALADLDGDAYLEIVIGSTDHNVYCFEWNGVVGSTEWAYPTAIEVYSSAAIGDVDGDGSLEAVVGSNDGNVYCLNALGIAEWIYSTGGAVVSSPALAKAGPVDQYARDWPMFRNNPRRTGLYGMGSSTHLDVYVGSDHGYLYLLDGDTGSLIDRFQVYTGSMGSIHTSPSVADIDGDLKLEIVFYDWGYGSVRGGNTLWCLEDTGEETMTATIETYCYTEAGYVGVDVTMDGSPTGYKTPHAFTNLVGSHTFTVPQQDSSGHSFINWSTGQTSTTITVTQTGTYTAYYGTGIHDVAVEDVKPLKSIVGHNYSMSINVTVANPGDFVETLGVIVYYDDFKLEWEILWAKGDISGDGYIDNKDQQLLMAAYGSKPEDPNWNPYADLDHDLLVDFADLSILGAHYGLNTWNYLGVPPPITVQLVTNLASGSSMTISLVWDTTGYAYGSYTLSAYARPVTFEGDLTNNNFLDGNVQVCVPGDLNADNTVDSTDLGMMGGSWGKFPGDLEYIPEADINDDGSVDSTDLGIMGTYWGPH